MLNAYVAAKGMVVDDDNDGPERSTAPKDALSGEASRAIKWQT
jgi:hypothetical protein